MVNPLAPLRQEKLRIDKVENASVAPNTERTLSNRNGPGRWYPCGWRWVVATLRRWTAVCG
jgi:hypothetical protein